MHCADLFFTHLKPTYTQGDRDAFMRGTLFPDIRYISPISREKTHAKNVTLHQILNASSPFNSGMLFHSYVDEQRTLIAQQANISNHLKDIPKKKRTLFLKMLEDELCYSLINSKQIRKALLRYDTEESSYEIFFLRRIIWHRIQREFLKQSPLALLERKVDARQGYFSFSYETLAQTLPVFKKYKEDTTVTRYMRNFLKSFEKLLIDFRASIIRQTV